MTTAFAQQAPSREQELLRRLRQQVQQLQGELSDQQLAAQRAAAEKGLLQARLDALEAQQRRAQGSASAQAGAHAKLQKELDALQQQRATLQAQLDAQLAELQAGTQSVARLRDANAGLQRGLAQRDGSLADLQARHAVQAQGLQSCIASNRQLHAIGSELLQRYADKGVAEALVQNEPFLQFRRVALENLVQGYEDKLDQQALAPPVPGGSSAGSAARAP